MGKRAEGLSWITRSNKQQIQWAVEYLKKASPLSRRLPNTSDTYETLIRAGHELEMTAEGARMLQKMRSAWRQRTYRQVHEGQRPYTFTLPVQTKAALTRQAALCGRHEAEHLMQLIEKGHAAAVEYAQDTKDRNRKEHQQLKTKIEQLQLQVKELKQQLASAPQPRNTKKSIPADEISDGVRRESGKLQPSKDTLGQAETSNKQGDHSGISPQRKTGSQTASHESTSPACLERSTPVDTAGNDTICVGGTTIKLKRRKKITINTALLRSVYKDFPY